MPVTTVAADADDLDGGRDRGVARDPVERLREVVDRCAELVDPHVLEVGCALLDVVPRGRYLVAEGADVVHARAQGQVADTAQRVGERVEAAAERGLRVGSRRLIVAAAAGGENEEHEPECQRRRRRPHPPRV